MAKDPRRYEKAAAISTVLQTLNNNNMDTRCFFVVESIEDERELFETLGEAEKHFYSIPAQHRPRIAIAVVRNAYREEGQWNYEDYSDTFSHLTIIR